MAGDLGVSCPRTPHGLCNLSLHLGLSSHRKLSKEPKGHRCVSCPRFSPAPTLRKPHRFEPRGGSLTARQSRVAGGSVAVRFADGTCNWGRVCGSVAGFTVCVCLHRLCVRGGAQACVGLVRVRWVRAWSRVCLRTRCACALHLSEGEWGMQHVGNVFGCA